MNEDVKWTAGNGKEIAVTVKVDYDLDRQGDRKTGGHRVASYDLTIDGVHQSCTAGVIPINHRHAVAKIGNVGITAENMERIEAATAELMAAVADHNAACDAHVAELDQITNATAALERMMAYGEQ